MPYVGSPLSHYCAVLDRAAGTNQLHAALKDHIETVCKDWQLAISTPAELEDQVTEWLAENEPKFKRCPSGRIVLINNRPYRGCETLRVYVEANTLDLYMLIIIGFRPSTLDEEERTCVRCNQKMNISAFPAGKAYCQFCED